MVMGIKKRIEPFYKSPLIDPCRSAWGWSLLFSVYSYPQDDKSNGKKNLTNSRQILEINLEIRERERWSASILIFWWWEINFKQSSLSLFSSLLFIIYFCCCCRRFNETFRSPTNKNKQQQTTTSELRRTPNKRWLWNWNEILFILKFYY